MDENNVFHVPTSIHSILDAEQSNWQVTVQYWHPLYHAKEARLRLLQSNQQVSRLLADLS